MAAFRLKDYSDAWNTHDVEKLLSLYADDAELVDASARRTLRGKDAIRGAIEEYLRAFPDVNGAIETSVASGDTTAAVFHVSGKQTGAWNVHDRELPATDRKVEYRLAVFLQTDGQGRIKREVEIADTATILDALGLVPEEQATRRSRS